jgi:hypothetical protein
MGMSDHFLLFFALALVAALPPNDDCSTAATLACAATAHGQQHGRHGLAGSVRPQAMLCTFTTNSVAAQWMFPSRHQLPQRGGLDNS